MEVRYPAAEPYETGMLDAGDGNPGAGEAASGGDLIAAYGRLMADSGPAVRARAAAGWPAWEDATISLDPDGSPGAYSARPADLLLARAWPGSGPGPS